MKLRVHDLDCLKGAFDLLYIRLIDNVLRRKQLRSQRSIFGNVLKDKFQNILKCRRLDTPMCRSDIFFGVFVKIIVVLDDLVKVIHYSFFLVLSHQVEIQLDPACVLSSFDLHIG